MAKAVKDDDEDVKKEPQLSSKDILRGLMKESEGFHYNHITPKHKLISSGSLLMDAQVKVRSGSVLRLTGDGAELGKTSQSLVFADNFMKTMPKSKTIYFAAEGRLTPELKKRCGLKFVYNEDDWDIGTIFVYKGNVFEDVARKIETMAKAMFELGENLCVVIDSLDGLVLKADLQKDIWNGEDNVKVAGVPLLTKRFFQRCMLPIVNYDVLCIITSQYTAEIKLDMYAKVIKRQANSSGGSSISHQTDNALSYQARYGKDQILEKPKEKMDVVKNKMLGMWVVVEVKKSSSDVTGITIKYPIKKGRVGCAIWVELEIVEACLQWDLISRKGGWYYFDKGVFDEAAKVTGVKVPEKIQGLSTLHDLLEKEPKLTKFLFDKISVVISTE